jgi:hypothetical protein
MKANSMCSLTPEQERIVKQIMEPPLAEWRRHMREARERQSFVDELLRQHMTPDETTLKRLIDGYLPQDHEDDDIDLNSDDKIYARWWPD